MGIDWTGWVISKWQALVRDCKSTGIYFICNNNDDNKGLFLKSASNIIGIIYWLNKHLSTHTAYTQLSYVTTWCIGSNGENWSDSLKTLVTVSSCWFTGRMMVSLALITEINSWKDSIVTAAPTTSCYLSPKQDIFWSLPTPHSAASLSINNSVSGWRSIEVLLKVI